MPITKNGLSPSCIALPSGPWQYLIDFLIDRFPHIHHNIWLQRMAEGNVFNKEGAALGVETPYIPHSKIYYYRFMVNEAIIPFAETVIYQDDYLLVADKPHFLPVIPSGAYVEETLLVRLKRKYALNDLSPMHRIDRETAGLVVFIKQPHTRAVYQRLFQQQAVLKYYEAIACENQNLNFPLIHRSRLIPGNHFMQMKESKGAANTETRIQIIESLDGFARYLLSPITGKKHQLRVHMSALGMSILYDRIYPKLYPPIDMTLATTQAYSRPLQLLAKSLKFIDPITGDYHQFESQLKLLNLNKCKLIERF